MIKKNKLRASEVSQKIYPIVIEATGEHWIQAGTYLARLQWNFRQRKDSWTKIWIMTLEQTMDQNANDIMKLLDIRNE